MEKVSFLKRDPELALKYGLIACNLGVPQACANVSRYFVYFQLLLLLLS